VAPCSKANGSKKLSAASSFERLEGRRTDLMANKSYASTMLLLRIGVLAAQIAVSPSAAAQWRDFLVGEGARLVDFVREIPYPGNDDDMVWASREPDKELAASKLTSRGVLEGSKWEMQ
jgi:hypothetical protein